MFCIVAFSQKVISKPGVVLDTVVQNHHFILTWNGDVKIIPSDSISMDSIGKSIIHTNYASAFSVFRLTIQKIRIVSGDTIRRIIYIDAPFGNIANQLNGFFSNANVKKQISNALKPEVQKKISQE